MRARDLNTIHEKTTVSPGFGLTRLGNDFIFFVLEIFANAFSEFQSAVLSPDLAPSVPFDDKPALFSWERAGHIHRLFM